MFKFIGSLQSRRFFLTELRGTLIAAAILKTKEKTKGGGAGKGGEAGRREEVRVRVTI